MFVKINQGVLEGREDRSMSTGKIFYSFLGIPYAKPPVGELRFQPPVPAGSWKGIRDAKYDRSRCFAVLDPGSLANSITKEDSLELPINEESFVHQTEESEDCLYLNVFTPEPPNPDNPLKPVMVNIHGGGNHFGTGNMDSAAPDHLANYDVVLVSINYRLHILGFLNLNTPSSTGNCGCKDQVQALRWVQENIRCFGGDPENVTIYGASSGGNASHLLTISPLAAGLFHKAIVESGTIIGPWIQDDQVEVGFRIGRKLGFTGTDAEELVKFLKLQPVEALVKEATVLVAAQKSTMPFLMSGTQIFGPSIEKSSDNAFLPDYPANLIKISRPVPMLAGVADKEGVTILFGLEDIESLFIHLKYNFADLVKSNVPCDPSKVAEIVEKVKDYYQLDSLDDDMSNKEFREKIVEIYSHLYFMNLYDVTEATTKNVAPLYVYKFGYVGGLNISIQWHMNITGALHADELEYITLGRGFYAKGIQASKTDRKVIDIMCSAWTNFARRSNPNPLPDGNVRWSPHKCDDPSYMQFNEECVPKRGRIWNEGLAFWKQIFRNYVDWSDIRNRRLQLGVS